MRGGQANQLHVSSGQTHVQILRLPTKRQPGISQVGCQARQFPLGLQPNTLIVQQPGESARKFWTRFLTKKNQIIDCQDAEALATFKNSIRDEWLARHLGQEKPKSMAALTALMTRFCAREDNWLAR